MKIIVYPDQPAGGNLVLNGYVLSESGSNIPTTPDFYVDCGQVWFGSSYHPNFVAGRSGKIYCQIDGHKIIRFTPPLASQSQVEVLYQHTTWIRQLALRMITEASGVQTERLYFSGASPTASDGDRVQIYWLDQNGSAHPYLTIGKNDLPVPDPCQPGQDIPLFYAGEFTFNEQNTLFLSNGNCSPCGIFKIDGALPESVSGAPQRIFVTDSYSMSDLQYDGHGGLLFTDYSSDQTSWPHRLQRFDLATASTQIIWNTQGIQFRGFAVYPVNISAAKPDFPHLVHIDLEHLKRFKIKLDPVPSIRQRERKDKN